MYIFSHLFIDFVDTGRQIYESQGDSCFHFQTSTLRRFHHKLRLLCTFEFSANYSG